MWKDLSMKEKSAMMKVAVKNGIYNLDTVRHLYDKGGKLDKGGYPKDTLEKRKKLLNKYDPTGGFRNQRVYTLLNNLIGGENNLSRGEENEYYKEYLGLPSAVPKMNPSSKTEWDDRVEREKVKRGELPSDFYGTTPRMDVNIQALADTLNTGKIVRDYDRYKERHPELPTKKEVEYIYNSGKRLLENPNKWTQMEEDYPLGIYQVPDDTNETSPLGMLANFGAKWVPKENKIYVHDIYDFPSIYTYPGIMIDRPKEMKIRGAVGFNPKKGSYLLRNDLKNFNKEHYPKPKVK